MFNCAPCKRKESNSDSNATSFATNPKEAKYEEKRKLTKCIVRALYRTVKLELNVDYVFKDVPLKTLKGYLFTMESIQSKEEKSKKPNLIMVHGYFTSLGLWYQMMPVSVCIKNQSFIGNIFFILKQYVLTLCTI